MRLLLTCLALLLTFSLTVHAAKENKKGDPAAAIKKKLDSAELATEKLAEAKKIVDEHAAKLKDAQAKIDAVLTSEQKAAAKSARKAAKTAGKKRKEAQAEVQAALKLTDEQKTKLADAEKGLAAVKQELSKALSGILTKEQLAKAGLKTRKKKNA
jgi:hypothetical protein